MSPAIPFDIEAQKLSAAKLVEGVGLSTLKLAAQELQVVDDDTYAAAISLRSRFADAEKKVLDFWEPLTKAANALHKTLTGARTEMAKPYTIGKDLMTSKAERYIVDQKRIKREAEEALARMARTEQINLEEKADDLAAMGYMKEAEAVKRQSMMTVAPTLPSAIPVAAGARVGDKFTGKVVDVMAVLKSIVEGKTPLMWDMQPGDSRPLVVIDPAVLRSIVSRLQGGLRIPGIEVEEGARISTASTKR